MRCFSNKVFKVWYLQSYSCDEMWLYVSSNQNFFWYNFEYLSLYISWCILRKSKVYKSFKTDRLDFSSNYFCSRMSFFKSYFWVQTSIVRNYTMKVRGSRMGRGKGGVKKQYFYLSSGLHVLRIANLGYMTTRLVVNGLQGQILKKFYHNWTNLMCYDVF